jgi:hypothetical protein
MTFMWLKSPQGKDDVECIRLGRLALDVMLRRQWFVLPVGQRWYVSAEVNPPTDGLGPDSMPIVPGATWPDPYTALVEAERWYVERVDNKPPVV